MIKNLFTEKILTAVGIILAVMLVVLLIYFALDVFLLGFAAILLAVFLRGLADLINEYLHISEGKAVLVVSLVLVIILGSSIALLAPSVAEQFNHLREELPRSAETVSQYVSQYSWGRAILEQMPSAADIESKVNTMTVLSSVGGFFSTTAGMLANFFIAILLAIYLAAEPKIYIDGFSKLIPINSRPRFFQIVGEIGETLRWWLIGKFGSMLVIGILTWIGLSILGVPLALTLALIAGLLSFIPNFGPILSAIPALLFAFIESPVTALYVAGLYVGVQLIESNLVTPWIERQTVELPPALTIIFQLILGVLTGALGLVLATPILAVGMVLVQMLYVEDVLGDKETSVNEKKTEEDLADEEIEREDLAEEERKKIENTEAKIVKDKKKIM